MIRIGIVDFDTSHAIEFTKRLNQVDIAPDQWVEGARVVAGVPGNSEIAPEVIPSHTEAMRGYGVKLYEDPTDLFGHVDAVLITSLDGCVHMERALPFLEEGIPTYVDKPFACSLADARAMFEEAHKKEVALMSCSSLRFAPEVTGHARGEAGTTGAIIGASTHGPAPWDARGRNPGLFHYGIHPVEMLYSLMGPGCHRLTCLGGPDGEVVTGIWSRGRVGTIRGIRKGCASYGFTIFGERAVTTELVSTRLIYRELLRNVVRMFQTRESPISPRETLEIIAFLEAATISLREGGKPVEVRV